VRGPFFSIFSPNPFSQLAIRFHQMGATTTTGSGFARFQTVGGSGPGGLAKSDVALLASLIAERIADGTPLGGGDYMNRLMSSADVVVARPGLTRAWLYEHAEECGAIRRNKSQRSPFWFRLCDVDAAIDGARCTATPAERAAQVYGPRRGRPKRRQDGDDYTAKGSPRSFTIRPRGSD
jgi:hypothetical protein